MKPMPKWLRIPAIIALVSTGCAIGYRIGCMWGWPIGVIVIGIGIVLAFASD